MDRLLFLQATRNYFGVARWLAADYGLFAAEGLEVTIESVPTTDTAGERVRNGTGDLSTSAMEQIIIDRDAGGPLIAIAGNVNRMPFSLIAQPSIRTIADLRGKAIGVSSLKTGTSAILTKLFARHGLARDDYRFVDVGPIETRWAMLQSGEIDAGLQGVPLDFVAIDAGFSNLGSSMDLFPELQFAAFTVEEDWARRHREVLVRFLRAMVRAFRLLYADKEKSTQVANRYGGFTRDYAERAWEVYTRDGVFPRNGEINMPGLRTLIEVSAEARGVPDRALAKAESYVDLSYLDEALATLGE